MKEDKRYTQSTNSEDSRLSSIRHFKGTVMDFKSFWDSKAGRNTNAFNTPHYNGFGNHPVSKGNQSPHWKQDDKKL